MPMISERKRGVWSVRVYVGKDPLTGKERHVFRTLRGTKTDARQLERKLQVEVSAGKHQTPNVTVSELLDRWLDHAAPGLSPTTIYTYRRYIDHTVRPGIGTVRLSKLTTARLDGLYARLRDSGGHNGRGLSPATIRQVHAILRRALRQAQRWGWIDRNPAELATLPPVRRTQHAIPSPAEIGSLIDAAKDAEDGLALAIWLAAVTGVRRGELCGLRWSDLDLEAGSLLVERSVVDVPPSLTVKDTKTHQARRVAVDAQTVGMLREHRVAMAERALKWGVSLHPDAYVLSESLDGAGPLHPNLVTSRFRRLCRREGITCRLHDLRHWHVSQLLGSGVNVRQVASRVGHASATMTLDVYGHAIDQLDQQAAETVANALR